MKNIPLLIFDLLCLPISIIRLFLIYFFGSRYNVPSLQFLDVMNHATERFFNQGQQDITIDTVPTDVRISINKSSRINTELLNEYAKFSVNKNNTIFGKYKNGDHQIILNTEKNISSENLKILQKLLPNILSQISAMNKYKHIDTENFDLSKLDEKLDEEIKKELDFMSLDIEKDLELDSLTG